MVDFREFWAFLVEGVLPLKHGNNTSTQEHGQFHVFIHLHNSMVFTNNGNTCQYYTLQLGLILYVNLDIIHLMVEHARFLSLHVNVQDDSNEFLT